MAWDSYQISEFNNHWQGTYVEIDNKLIYVEGATDFTKRTFSGFQLAGDKTPTSRKAKTFNMEDVRAKFMPAGFYSAAGHFWMFSHSPAQHSKRGMNIHNVAYGRCEMLTGGDISVLASDRIREEYLIEFYKAHKLMNGPQNWDGYKSSYLEGGASAIVLGRDYVIARTPKRQGGYRDLVCGLGGPIGSFNSKVDSISLDPRTAYVADSLDEQVKRTYNKELRINVA